MDNDSLLDGEEEGVGGGGGGGSGTSSTSDERRRALNERRSGTGVDSLTHGGAGGLKEGAPSKYLASCNLFSAAAAVERAPKKPLRSDNYTGVSPPPPPLWEESLRRGSANGQCRGKSHTHTHTC